VANTIKVTYRVNEDGSLEKISQKANRAAAATDKVTASTDRYSKKIKGVAGATSNSTKAFSKMTTGITGGLVPAYATLAANVFALTALFGALSRAASLRLLEDGLVRVGNAAGANLSVVSQKLKDITGNAISTESAMRSVALATSAGFSTKQLADLTKVARGASIALGRDMSDAMDRLVRGTAKLEPEILDELGIMVRLDDATAEYAITLKKSVQDLTQYERRMAFLTATNEQGLKKFGELGESVSVNPYDKLAASFKNLSNIMINILNYAIEPLVNILSSNPVALMAVVTMFAGTLVKQIVPAITASADAARKMASATSKEATRLAKKMEGSFKALAGSIKSLDFAPKSIKKIEADLQAGKIKGKELQQALRNVTQSEKLRAAALKNTTQENIAQKEKEIASVRRLKQEIQAAQAAEGKRGASSGALGNAKGMSSTSRKTAAAFKMMEGAGPLQGFQIAAASVGKQSKDVLKAEGALNKLTLGFRVAGNGAKLFGTALLNAIPVIGQLIMVGSILYPIISKLFEKDELAKAAATAAKSFDSFNGIGKQLKDTLAKNTSEAERYIITMRAQVGVVEQVSSAFSALQAAQSNMNNDKLIKSMQDIVDKKQGIANLDKIYENRAMNEKEAERYAGATEQLVQMEAAHKKLEESLDAARPAEALLVLGKAINTIKNSSTLSTSMASTLDGLEKLKVKFEASAAAGESMSYDDLIEETGKLLGRNKEVLASVDAATQVYNDFRKSVTDLGDKGSHALDGVLKTQRNLTNEMKQADVPGGRGLEAFLKQVPELQKTLNKFRKEKNLGFKLNEAGVQEALTDHVEHQKDIMLEQVQIQKRLGVETGKVKEFAAGNQEATKILIGLEEEVRVSKEKSLKAEKESFTVLEMQETKKDRLAEIERELAVIDRTRANSSIDTLTAQIEGIKHAQKLLDLTTQIAAAEKQIALDGMKIAENNARIAKMKTGRDFTPLDELKTFKATEKKREELIAAETDSKLASLDLEFTLLTAQTKLQIERAKLVEAEINEARKARNEAAMAVGTLSKPFEEILKLFPKLAAAKAQAILSADQSALSDLKTEGATKQSAVSKAAISASSTGDTTAERIKNTHEAGNPAEGLSKTAGAVATMTAQINQLDPMIEKLKTLGPDGEVVAALTGGAMAIQSAFLNMAHSLSAGMTEGLSAAEISAIETVSKLEIAGAAVSMLSETLAAGSRAKIAGIEAEISAEEKRDGKSAASIARIKALEKKKEGASRKAFEMNKKMQMAQVAIAVATSIAHNIAAASAATAASGGNPGVFAGVLGMMNAVTLGLGAAQIAIIAGTSYQGGGSAGAGAGAGPSSISIGNRENSVDLAKARSPSGEQAYARGSAGAGSGMTNYTPAFTGMKYRASGGNTGFMVGEQGPEMFIPDRPGRISPADEVAGMGAPMNVNFTIQAIDAQGIEQVLNSQRGNLIGMIREAANAHGEEFLENVNVQAYQGSAGGGRQYDGTSGRKSK
jgi:hypothetical protein